MVEDSGRPGTQGGWPSQDGPPRDGSSRDGSSRDGREAPAAGLRRLDDAELDARLRAHASWLAASAKPAPAPDLSRTDLGHRDLAGQDLSHARLRGARLFKAVLTDAKLNDADLRGADLGQADLAGADLSAADLRGAHLRDVRGLARATLVGVKLDGASGLLGSEFAGADLTDAKLPEHIRTFERLAQAEKISQHARNIFLTSIGGCVYAWLTVATTTDAALLVNTASTPLPIIDTEITLAGFYWAAPAIVFALYVYLHLYLLRLWEGLARLPAIFPDGARLDERAYPWLLSGLLQWHVPLLAENRPSLSWLQAGLAILAAWILVPATLALFWLRYLVRQDLSWSLFQMGLLVLSVWLGVYCYRRAAAALGGRQPVTGRGGAVRAGAVRVAAAGVAGAMAWLLCDGAVNGVPREQVSLAARAEGHRGLVPWAVSALGFRTFAKLRDADVSTKPERWLGRQEDLLLVTGADLAGISLRHADAEGAFLVRADLRRADLRAANLRRANLESAKLRGADLRGADLTGASLQVADLRGADFRGARLSRAKFQGARLEAADLRGADLRFAQLRGSRGLVPAQLDDACGNKETGLPFEISLRPCPGPGADGAAP